ncbi:hypothetical protein JM946_12600 [Steroidobacter sp. S1-65]|uniref:Uncharacterized protein n=1 Tax=Steroidobacter gossypii TaxID=2805490 RepID=A0ABS1WXA3_9GAMM|nr:hypothetical protein [Steroidobacter gossypii]MBM0105598.1 hypothetical protein [Steroidobacter gossypii]
MPIRSVTMMLAAQANASADAARAMPVVARTMAAMAPGAAPAGGTRSKSRKGIKAKKARKKQAKKSAPKKAR